MKLSIEQPLLDSFIRIHSTIPQQRPVCAVFVDAFPFDVGDDEFFFIGASFGNDLSARRNDKSLSPKLDSVSAGGRFVTQTQRISV